MIIQIIEDDHALSDGITLALKEPELEFVQSMTVKQAKEDVEMHSPELVILDVNLPDGSGYDFLKWLRERSQIPVLMLTANDMEMDEVMGLNLGADDYMTKPFSLAVLRARVQVLRRRISKAADEVYQVDGLCFDFERIHFTKDGQEISLSVNEQKLLRLLVTNEGRILTREILMERIWQEGSEYIDENALSVTINRLRSKLEDKELGCTYIQTVYGQGYMWKKKER